MIGQRKVTFGDQKILDKKKDSKTSSSPVKKLKETSETFWDAIIHSSSLVILCEFCGRVHFATWSEGDYDDGEELTDLKKRAKINPDRYIEDHEYSSIRWGYLDGKQIVYRCKCNSAARFENWIWDHRRLISDYLSARVKELEKKLEEEKELVAQLEGMKL